MFGRCEIPQVPWQPVASCRAAPGNRDRLTRCPGEVRQPQVEHVSPSLFVIRVFDKLAVDSTTLTDRLGDDAQPIARCGSRAVTTVYAMKRLVATKLTSLRAWNRGPRLQSQEGECTWITPAFWW